MPAKANTTIWEMLTCINLHISPCIWAHVFMYFHVFPSGLDCQRPHTHSSVWSSMEVRLSLLSGFYCLHVTWVRCWSRAQLWISPRCWGVDRLRCFCITWHYRQRTPPFSFPSALLPRAASSPTSASRGTIRSSGSCRFHHVSLLLLSQLVILGDNKANN